MTLAPTTGGDISSIAPEAAPWPPLFLGDVAKVEELLPSLEAAKRMDLITMAWCL
jgi:hypothetical protein